MGVGVFCIFRHFCVLTCFTIYVDFFILQLHPKILLPGQKVVTAGPLLNINLDGTNPYDDNGYGHFVGQMLGQQF